MKVGYIGAGKLGMPVAACVAQKHDVKIYDADKSVYARWGTYPFVETAEGTPYDSVNDLMNAVDVRFVDTVAELDDRDIIFVAVQTPHQRQFEGDLPLPDDRADFDYSYLRAALEQLANLQVKATVVVISTCLPGTYKREFKNLPLKLVYNPYFIAMGSVIPDFLDPEFVLVGTDGGDLSDLYDFYDSFTLAHRMRIMSITSAEATKVFYNTFISMKLSFANVVAEACDKVGANCDDVMGAIRSANKRLVSGAYLNPGMGDGGGCHPRDNIALSWFAREHGMSFDFFGMLMEQREEQAQMLATEMLVAANGGFMGIVGLAFKPDTNIKTGSHAVLVANIITDKKRNCGAFDRHLGGGDPQQPGTYLVGCAHEYIRELAWPKGSVVIDPWGIVPAQDGVDVRRFGRA